MEQNALHIDYKRLYEKVRGSGMRKVVRVRITVTVTVKDHSDCNLTDHSNLQYNRTLSRKAKVA